MQLHNSEIAYLIVLISSAVILIIIVVVVIIMTFPSLIKCKNRQGWTNITKIKTDCNCGFLKTCQHKSFLKFIFVVCNV